MIYKRTSDAASEPITTTEAKLHLKVDVTDDDTLIDRLIKAARRSCEMYTERSFITQTWKAYGDSFPETIELIKGPVISVTSVQYVDSDGVTQTYSTDDYTVDIQGDVARIKPVDSWPDIDDIMNAVIVTYQAGYGSASDVPEDIKAAMLLIIGKLYQDREDTVKRMPTHAQWLLDPYKVYYTI